MNLPLDPARRSPILPPGRAIAKRTFDLAVAVAGLVFLAPIIAVAACGARLAHGHAFFSQTRVGLYGLPFRLHKICTMRQLDGVTTTVTTSRDPRLTSFGRFLRRTKIDELPQLWNVIKGDMSLVGPRPDVPSAYGVIEEKCADALRVKPGLTSPVSITLAREEEMLAGHPDPERYNAETLWPQKMTANAQYARNQTFFADLGILIATIFAILRPRQTGQAAALRGTGS